MNVDLGALNPDCPIIATTPLLVGFDGSFTAFGWAIVTIEAHPKVRHAGCARTKPPTKSAHLYAADKDGPRVDSIAYTILAVLDEALSYGVPVIVAIESPAGSQSSAGAKGLGLAYGISRTACAAKRLIPITVQAGEVRITIGKDKDASKADVAKGVFELTGWTSNETTGPAKEGASDAAGVALTAILNHPVVSAFRSARS